MVLKISKNCKCFNVVCFEQEFVIILLIWFCRYRRLNKAIVDLIEGQNIVSFVPLNVKDKRTMELVRKNIDRANGYIFSPEENQNAEMLNSVMRLDINDLTFDVLEDVPEVDSAEMIQN